MAIADGGMVQGGGGVRHWEPESGSDPSENGTEKVKLCTRVNMVMERTRSMILDDLERFELMMVTTGRLSHQKQIRLPDQ